VSCGSALVEDGKLVAAITDERLVREKNGIWSTPGNRQEDLGNGEDFSE